MNDTVKVPGLIACLKVPEKFLFVYQVFVYFYNTCSIVLITCFHVWIWLRGLFPLAPRGEAGGGVGFFWCVDAHPNTTAKNVYHRSENSSRFMQ